VLQDRELYKGEGEKRMRKVCPNCSRIFESNTSKRVYCDKVCYKAVRKASHNRKTLLKYRKDNHVHEKWIKELESVGYLVIKSRDKK
jgi:ribosomal protein S27AE